MAVKAGNKQQADMQETPSEPGAEPVPAQILSGELQITGVLDESIRGPQRYAVALPDSVDVSTWSRKHQGYPAGRQKLPNRIMKWQRNLSQPVKESRGVATRTNASFANQSEIAGAIPILTSHIATAPVSVQLCGDGNLKLKDQVFSGNALVPAVEKTSLSGRSLQSLQKIGAAPGGYMRKGNSLVRATGTIGSRQVTASGRAQLNPLPQTSWSLKAPFASTGLNSNVSRSKSRPSTPSLSGILSRPRTPPMHAQETRGTLSVQSNSVHPHPTGPPREPSPVLSASAGASQSGGPEVPAVAAQMVEYVKTKRNQLVVAPDPTGTRLATLSLPGSEGTSMPQGDELANGSPRVDVKSEANQLVVTTTLLSNGASSQGVEGLEGTYVRSKANQLVRNGPRSRNPSPLSSPPQKASVGAPVPSLLLGESSSAVLPRGRRALVRALSAPRSRKSFREGSGPQTSQLGSHSSRVWKLGGAASASKSASKGIWQSICCQPILPWKRPSLMLLRRSSKDLAIRLQKDRGTLRAFLRRRLERQRKIEALYTRSNDGFSLRRSGVRSLVGSNMTWTKWKEEKVKEASKEATKAVAAAEKKKREKKQAAVQAVAAAAKAKVDRRAARKAARAARIRPRDKVVMVGLLRYKMDPSGHTLQRLPDSPVGESSKASEPQMATPRRASIGGTSYVRLGSSTQLVRDPKSASKALASERVRYSLHNARLRKAKAKGYCQFYTRFGKCKKKDSGQCPYIHDPEKVAVCTKFLRGTCTNADCLLTHKVIAERMPDCSYFLQGLCTNEECPYRHVKVNSEAPVCEGFLKGYCEEGDACDKKHTYVCPTFAATGKCPEGSKCRLQHPKAKERGGSAKKGSKAQTRLSGTKRRYFESGEGTSGDREDGQEKGNEGYSPRKGQRLAEDLGEGGIPLEGPWEGDETG